MKAFSISLVLGLGVVIVSAGSVQPASAAEISVIESFRRTPVKVFAMENEHPRFKGKRAVESLGSGPWAVQAHHPSGFYAIDAGGERLWVAETDITPIRKVPDCTSAIAGRDNDTGVFQTPGLGERCKQKGK